MITVLETNTFDNGVNTFRVGDEHFSAEDECIENGIQTSSTHTHTHTHTHTYLATNDFQTDLVSR